MKLKNRYHLYASITILFWSLAYVITRLALQYFTTTSLGFLRYLVASVTLAIFVVIAKIKPPKRKDLGLFFLSGAVGFFLYMIFFNKGQALVTASTGSVVIATVPVITALLARVIYKENLLPYQWLAILIQFLGVAVLTLYNGILSINSGLLWLLLAALALSAYNLLQRRLTREYTALQAAAYSIFGGTLLLAIYAPGAWQEGLEAPPIQLLYLLILGVLSSAVAYVAWSKAFTKAKYTSQVSNYMFATPLVTSLLGFLLANETPDQATVVGGIIILAGMAVYNFGGQAYGLMQRHRRKT